MKEGNPNKKILTLASVVVLASGLLAWALVALFQADSARWEAETAGEEFYDEEIPLEDLEAETELTPAAPGGAQPPAPAGQTRTRPAAPAQPREP